MVVDEINNNDINFPPNTTWIVPQQKFDNEPTIDVDYEEEIIVVPPPKDYAHIKKSLNKTAIEIHNDKVEDIDVDINDNDDVDIVNIAPSHPRDPSCRKIRNRDNKETDGPYITRVNRAHPRCRMRHILRNRPVNLEVDFEVQQDLPYLNTKIKVGELNKAKQHEAIFDTIITK